MTITVQRGTDQIGGTVTEISSNSTKILIDFGSQLEGAEKKELNIDWDSGYDAVFLTHYHGDHIGEIDQIPEDVPVYFGKTATEMSIVLTETLIKGKQADKKVLKKDQVLHKIQEKNHFLEQGKTLEIGDLKITPYHADHSAYDAYMLLIECGGKRILHTGDFRLNGYTGAETLENFQKIEKIDYLITEGTTLSRDGYVPESEASISQKAKGYLAKHKYVFVLCSSMNIDYIASIVGALPPYMPLICDEYQKKILVIVSNENSEGIYNFKDKKINIIQKGGKKYEHNISKGFCMLVRAKNKKAKFTLFKNSLKNHANKPDSLLLYGLWDGCLHGKHKKTRF
ncbi:MAG: MBL fold metallo-hydrolase [Eubacteriales bacterium]